MKRGEWEWEDDLRSDEHLIRTSGLLERKDLLGLEGGSSGTKSETEVLSSQVLASSVNQSKVPVKFSHFELDGPQIHTVSAAMSNESIEEKTHSTLESAHLQTQVNNM